MDDGILSTILNSNVTACQDLCHNNDACRFFNFWTSDYSGSHAAPLTCRLYTLPHDTDPSDDARGSIIGPRTCDNYQIGVRIDGNQIESRTERDNVGCHRRCMVTSGCLFFSYNPFSLTCRTHSANTATIADADWLTASFSFEMDECTGGIHNCNSLADCTDTTDSFTCACNTVGYSGDGVTCS
eukprot:Cvel_18783.t1-p1 / transcript=Cvel_18783.t1 / gene=Cvel_18783 / organism=Chromera_velia_CCMP2878 / gene_product=Fibrillin-1, putative / transcript_product=Fibrillin-1, putative / location=Cvel_scaffold1577:19-1393(-) / protein_length=183 / sequence_SO=supercontig / SO=protein_coding / is_pseudo=false